MTAVQTSPQANIPSTSNNDAPAADFDLRAEIKRLLDETELSDPREIANTLLPAIPRELTRSFAAAHVAEVASSVITYQRSHVIRRRSKWDGVADQRDEIALLRLRVFVGGGHKMLGQCTVEDVAFVLDEHRRQAKNLIERGQVYKRLAKAMRDYDAHIVADLPADVLETIFDA